MLLIDARNLPEDTSIEYDICIVGAGAAGITLAREFINQPKQVCLLESGGLDLDEVTQTLYQGDNIGDAYFPLKETRARYLGGSTNLWGGWSRPLDEIDFEDRPWMPYSGWAFRKAELDRYYERAQTASNLGACEYDFTYWQEALEKLQLHHFSGLSDDIVPLLWQIIPPSHLRFGKAYRAELEQARNIHTYLHANVVEIETNDTAQAVTQLRVATLDGKKFVVKAKVFILAVGGIENPRLLLLSNQVQSAGLGNQYDLVGRFFMEHPYLISGKARLANPACLYTRKNISVSNIFMGTGLGLTKAVQEREQILNFGMRLLPHVPEWAEAFNRLRFRNQQPKEHRAFPTMHEGHKAKTDVPISQDLLTVIANFDRIAARVYHKVFHKKSFGVEQSKFCDTHLIGEQAPNPDSRITLSRDRDALGLNQVQLDWRLSPIDKYTMVRSQQIIAAEFEQNGVGKFEIELTDDDSSWEAVKGSYHHMGTTRMSINPRQGVVDENCQVHGINNLYVAGSSVFPTSGLSNPTLTIVALAIRLADHLKARMSVSNQVTKALEVTSI